MHLLPRSSRHRALVGGIAGLTGVLAMALALVAPTSVFPASADPVPGWTDPDSGQTSFVSQSANGCTVGVDEFSTEIYGQGWTVIPAGVHHALVTAVGEAGQTGADGGAGGGLGGEVSAIVPATPGQNFYASPASSVTQDFSGEFPEDFFANGGRASFISTISPITFIQAPFSGLSPSNLCLSEFYAGLYPYYMPSSDLVLVAGGGGGGGPLSGAGGGGNAGPDGNPGGGAVGASPGGGGTQTAGGSYGIGNVNTGGPGAYLAGGDQHPLDGHVQNAGGGGGAGYYGGGSGGIGTGRAGGGGGSNYVMPVPNDGISTVISNGTSTLPARVSIIPIYEPTVTISTPENPAAIGGTSVTVTVSGLPISNADRAGGGGTVSLFVNGVETQQSFDPLVGIDTGVRTATFPLTQRTTGTVSYSATYSGDTSQQSDTLFGNIVDAESSSPLSVLYKSAITTNVNADMTFGDSTATFSHRESLPTGVTISGTATCTTADGGTALSALSAGSHSVDPASCSGLTLGGAMGSNYVLGYAGTISVDQKIITASVTGTQPSGGSPVFSDTVNPPSASALVTGSPTCSTLDDGTPIVPNLAEGVYTLGNCAGLSLAVPDPGDYALTLLPGQFIAGTSSPTLTIPALAAAVAGSPLDTRVTLADGDEASGEVSLSFYDDNDCSGPPLNVNSASVSGNGDYDTGSVLPDHAGDYSMNASYTGDFFNAAAATTCKIVSVGVADAGTTFSIPATGVVGEPLTARATFSSSVDRTGGNVTFILFPPTDTTCTGQTALLDVSYPVVRQGSYTSAPYTPTAPGTYRWVIIYPGDSNHAGANTICQPTVIGGPPTVTSDASTSFTAGTSGSFTVTTTAGTPATTALSVSGALPGGVTFIDNGDGTATLSGTPATSSTGTYPLTITAANSLTSSTQTFVLTVAQSPTITSQNSTTFSTGNSGSFTVTTAAGFPTTTALSESGALPTGVTFTDNQDGTATLSGTPGATTGGSYPLTFAAGNSTAPDIAQTFTLTVDQPIAIAGTAQAVFQVGQSGTHSIETTAGYPAASTLDVLGTLPSGLQFTDSGDGTGTITGTPEVGTGGDYPVTVTADNGVGTAPGQNLEIIVNEPPGITSSPSTSFTTGTSGNFTITTTAGFPATTTLQESGALPTGVTFSDNQDGTGTLSGVPAGTAGGSYPLTITASNGTSPNATQSFVLTVVQSPIITSANNTTFTAGNSSSFAITTTAGFPATTELDEAGALPAGIHFTDDQDGTGTLSGTPGATAGGSYPLTITAGNGATPNATQTFVLKVAQSPTVTSSTSTSFTTGTSGNFTIATAAGFPETTTLQESGVLPTGVTFTDNQDGTGTLSGAPGATTGGSYPLAITASNGSAPDATQSFTLTVAQPVAIPSTAQAQFQVGQSGTHSVTTTAGYPTSSTLGLTGSLPSGLSFVDSGNGTGTIDGTPDVGTGGLYPVTITASNGVGAPAVQALEVTVDEPPAITSANTWTSTIGVTSSFTVTTTPGYPTPYSLNDSGALPPGLSLAISDGSATISGIPTGVAGDYPITLTASNGIAPDAVQTLTLTVADASPVPLPFVPPVGADSLDGVPALSQPGQSFSPSATGFAPGAPITWGIYSTPQVLATSVADATGKATAGLTIPTAFAGLHTVVAIGIAPDGSSRVLVATTTVITPVTIAQLPNTGAPVGTSPAAAMLLLALGLALVLVVRFRRSRRRA